MCVCVCVCVRAHTTQRTHRYTETYWNQGSHEPSWEVIVRNRGREVAGGRVVVVAWGPRTVVEVALWVVVERRRGPVSVWARGRRMVSEWVWGAVVSIWRAPRGWWWLVVRVEVVPVRIRMIMEVRVGMGRGTHVETAGAHRGRGSPHVPLGRKLASVVVVDDVAPHQAKGRWAGLVAIVERLLLTRLKSQEGLAPLVKTLLFPTTHTPSSSSSSFPLPLPVNFHEGNWTLLSSLFHPVCSFLLFPFYLSVSISFPSSCDWLIHTGCHL